MEMWLFIRLEVVADLQITHVSPFQLFQTIVVRYDSIIVEPCPTLSDKGQDFHLL
jgi:hypothetical protein